MKLSDSTKDMLDAIGYPLLIILIVAAVSFGLAYQLAHKRDANTLFTRTSNEHGVTQDEAESFANSFKP